MYLPKGKRPKCRIDHCCLVPKLEVGAVMQPPPIHLHGVTQRHYFYGMKFVLQKWGNIIIRSTLSSNGVSRHMILFHILKTWGCYFHYITSRSNSWIRIEMLELVYNMGLLVYFSFVYLLVTTLQTGRSRDRFPMVSLEFLIDIILPAALWPWGGISL
jgi:hypothetical protein